MAAKRCSRCSIPNYPLHILYCRVCGEKLTQFSNAAPDQDWQEQVERLQARATESDEATRVFRFKRDKLYKAGWPWEYAESLAREPEIDWHRAEDLIKGGASVELALDILL